MSTNSREPNYAVTWASLPHKDQLSILFLSRFADFLQTASLQAYIFHQVKYLDSSLSDVKISQQVGLLQGCFTGAQVVTAILWGKAADDSFFGRRWVIIIGLGGTALSCAGYGFAKSILWAAFWRVLGGAINGSVGVVRTMIAEMVHDERHQSRAFLILPLSSHIANILGPVIGGILADPAMTLPVYFGEKAIFGFQWIREYPFALPSLISACSLATVAGVAFVFLEETSPKKRGRTDVGLQLGIRLKQLFLRRSHVRYSPIPYEMNMPMEGFQPRNLHGAKSVKFSHRRLPFNRIWTRNVISTFVTEAFYDFHLGAINSLWPLFLSAERFTPSASHYSQSKGSSMVPLSGGLGLAASTIGIVMPVAAVLGLLLQLYLYPSLQLRLGTLRLFQYFLSLFPIAYFIIPYVSSLPSRSPPPAAASGAFTWTGVIVGLSFQVTARTFTLPASIILLNNCSPHPSVLGIVHGMGYSISALFRTIGPAVGGWWYGYWLKAGMGAYGWWGLSGLSAIACVTALGMEQDGCKGVFLDGNTNGELVDDTVSANQSMSTLQTETCLAS